MRRTVIFFWCLLVLYFGFATADLVGHPHRTLRILKRLIGSLSVPIKQAKALSGKALSDCDKLLCSTSLAGQFITMIGWALD
jgi:hypothetical protein